MSADLTEAVETAARALYASEQAACMDDEMPTWEETVNSGRDWFRDRARHSLDAAAPLIEAQVRAQVAAQIKVRATQLRDRSEEHAASGYESVAEHFRDKSDALYGAAEIIRGDS